MEKLSELIDYISDIRKKSPAEQPRCDLVQLKNGSIFVYKSHVLTANIEINMDGKTYLFQVEWTGDDMVNVYPPKAIRTTERSELKTHYDIDEPLSCFKSLDTNPKVIDLLIKNLAAL